MPNIIERLSYAFNQKSMYDLHPELRYRIPVLRLSGEFESGVPENYFSYYEKNVWVRTAITRIADNIAPLKIQVVDREKQIVKGHQITKLLEHVNDTQAASDLWRAWTVGMLVEGETGFEITDGYKEIFFRERDIITVRIPEGGRRYLDVKSYKIEDGHGPGYEIPPEFFIHFKFYNPYEPFRGLSPMSAIRLGIQIDEFARAWSRLAFKNGMVPPVTIIAPSGLTPNEKEEIKDDYQGQVEGLANAHRPVVIEHGIVDIKTNNYKPTDTAWLEQREMSRTEIASLYGVPGEIAGYGSKTFENFANAKIMFWTITLTPLIGSRDDQLTEFFRGVGLLGPDQFCQTDLSEIVELQENKTDLINQAGLLITQGSPANLAYEEVGLNIRIPGGDVGYLPINLIPVTSLGSSGEARGFSFLQHRKDLAGPEYGSPFHVATMRRKESRIQQFELLLIRMLKKAFQRQQIEVGRKLRDRKSLGSHATTKIPVDSLFNLYDEIEKFKAEFTPFFRELLETIGADELASLGIDVAFDLDRPEVRAEMEILVEWLASKTNETTYQGLTHLFQEAEASGATIPEMMDSLSVFFEGRKSPAQTERIARTTMTASNNAGDEQAWKQSGVVKGSTWSTALDNRVRDGSNSDYDHLSAHGQFRQIGQMFDVSGEKLQFPGDPNGSAGNIINCRCSRIPVIIDLGE